MTLFKFQSRYKLSVLTGHNGTFLESQYLGGSPISVSLKPALRANRVLGQARLHSDIYFEGTNKRLVENSIKFSLPH